MNEEEILEGIIADHKRKKNHKKEVESLKEEIRPKRKIPIDAKDFLSTGSTMLNLAQTGDPFKGIFKGDYFYFVGDSSSGKSWISMNILAEAVLNPSFDNYRFIQDTGERGTLMDIAKYYGRAVKKRLEPPAKDKKGNPLASSLIEEFYYYLDDAFKDGRPFIYIKDSMDDLSDEASREKFQEKKTAFFKGKETTGTYGTGKASINSSWFRDVLHNLHSTGSILILISQTRDSIGFGSQFNPKTRSGGRALSFYAQIEVWSSIRKRLTRHVNGKDRHIGNLCQFHVKRSRITGRECSVEVPIYWSVGIDDIGSCVDFIVEEGHWNKAKKSEEGEEKKKKKKELIVAPEFDFTGSTEALVQHIEENNLEDELRKLTGEVWRGIEEKCEVKRKPRY